MESVNCGICGAVVPAEMWASHITSHDQAVAPAGNDNVKRALHSANAWEGISPSDQAAMRQLKSVEMQQRLWMNKMLRTRSAPSAQEVLGLTPAPAPAVRVDNPPPAPVAPAPQVIVKYLCPQCQQELMPGVGHSCFQPAPKVAPPPDGRSPFAR